MKLALTHFPELVVEAPVIWIPRRFLALLFLVVYATAGQLQACACEFHPVASECGAHDHQHEEPAGERHCECPTCHPCCHATFVVDALDGDYRPGVQAQPHRSSPASEFLPLVVSEIFIPPKLNA